MSDASIHFPEKWGGWHGHSLENSSENFTAVFKEGDKLGEKGTFLKCCLKAFFFNFLINHLVRILKKAVQNGFIMGINALINLRAVVSWCFAVLSVSRGSKQKSSPAKLRERSLYPRPNRWTTSNASSTVALQCKWFACLRLVLPPPPSAMLVVPEA